jgi:hypothetical protein
MVVCSELGCCDSQPTATAQYRDLDLVSDDVWGSKGVCRLVSRSIAAYLVRAWDVHNSCKHNGAVLPLSSGPGGGGAGPMALMLWLDLVI